MLIHLPIVILTSLHPVAVADSVPQFQIAQECQREGGTTEDEQRCVADEMQARDRLQGEWIQFTPSANCSATRRPAETTPEAMSNS